MNLHTSIGRLRLIGFIEACSYLFLLFVAEPIKFITGNKAPMKVSGMIHGVLVVLFMIALINVWYVHKWKISRAVIALLWSLVPFGTFIFDRSLRKEQQQLLHQ
jgi:integral membrane protein